MDQAGWGRRRWLRRGRRPAGILVVTAGLALLAAACNSGSPTTTGSGSTNRAQSAHYKVVAFSHCMRSHGVPKYPDPSSNQIDVKVGIDPAFARQYGVSASQLGAALHACQHLLPIGANDTFPAAMMPQILRDMRGFSRCMRSHGAPDWPDPTVNSQGQPGFNANPGSQDSAALNRCKQLEPPQLHGGVPLVR